MSTPRKRAHDNITAIVSILVFGAGFVALFAGFDHFYLIWILGWVVLVPIVAILFDEETDTDMDDGRFAHNFLHDTEKFHRDIKKFHRDIDDFWCDMGLSGRTRTRQRGRERTRTRTRTQQEEQENADHSPSTQDALATLRERYANGDLTDEQFERKLDRLLETETPENAAEWRERTTHGVETEKSR